jgi:hypothetical protein
MVFSLFIYFIPIILALIGTVLNSRLNLLSRKLLFLIVVSSAVFVFCCVHTNGSDWPNYLAVWNKLTLSSLLDTSLTQGIEIGFWGTMMLFKSIGIGFFPFLIILKSFSLIVISNFFRNYANKQGEGYSANVFFLLFLFYGSNAMYLYVETIIRFSVALAIVVLGYKFLLNRRFLPFLFSIIIATTFHRTAILLLPLYFLREIRISTIKWFIIFVIIIIFLSPQVILNILFSLKLKLFLPESFFNKVVVYVRRINDENAALGLVNIGNIVYLFFLVIILLTRKYIEEYLKNGKLLFTYVMIYFIIAFATMYMGSVGRIALYLNIFFIIILAYTLSVNRSTKQILVGIVVLYIIIAMAKRIIGLPGILYPYTNYLLSGFQ